MSTVYVVQDSCHNLSPAEEFGELQIMLSYKDIEQGVNHVQDKLWDELADIRSGDYLLLIGDPIAIGLAMIIATDIAEGRLTVLRWDRKHYKYQKEEIVI